MWDICGWSLNMNNWISCYQFISLSEPKDTAQDCEMSINGSPL
jgi:hypothetical protein